MIQAGVGYSGGGSAERAARTAAEIAMERAGLDRGDLAFVFATTDYRAAYTQLLSAVQRTTGVRHLVGCSGMGVLTTDGEFEHAPGVAVLVVKSRDLSAEPFLIRTGEPIREAPGQAIRRLIHPLPAPNPLLVVFPDIFTVHPAELLREIQEDATVLPIVGGAASGGPYDRMTFQWCGGDIEVHGVAGMLLSGAFRTSIGIAQGCQPIGEPYLISRARGNLILELNGRPAFDVLQEVVTSLPPEEVERAFHSLFAGLAIPKEKPTLQRGDFLVRTIAGIDPASGAVAIAEQVRPGQILQFTLRDANAARADMRRMLEHLYPSLRGSHPRFGFYFNCLGRGVGLYGDRHHDITLIKEFFVDLPVIGFFGNAELAPLGGRNYVHNYTGVLVVFSEG